MQNADFLTTRLLSYRFTPIYTEGNKFSNFYQSSVYFGAINRLGNNFISIKQVYNLGYQTRKSESVSVMTDKIYVRFVTRGPNQKVPLIHYAVQVHDALFHLQVLFKSKTVLLHTFLNNNILLKNKQFEP